MRIGQLRYRVDVEHKVTTQDPEYGTDIVTWALLAQAWAKVIGISGREYLQSNLEHAATTYRVTMRYRADIDTSMRIKHAGKYYGIEAILPDDRQELMTLMCNLVV